VSGGHRREPVFVRHVQDLARGGFRTQGEGRGDPLGGFRKAVGWEGACDVATGERGAGWREGQGRTSSTVSAISFLVRGSSRVFGACHGAGASGSE
jgi:hypothetical protein